MESRYRRRRRLKKPIRRALKTLFLLGVIGLVSAVAYGGYLAYTIKTAADDSYNSLDREKSELRKEKVEAGKDPISFLLIGVEDYQGDTGRSDVMLVVTINPETDEMTMVSIPRDTRAYIPAIEEQDKITHSYAFGNKGEREKAVIESVEGLLDIPIDYYVSTNFDGFVNVVDELGGVNVDVPFDFTETNMEGESLAFKEGSMSLDGNEALAYVRMRKQDPRGDLGRNQRQQQVLSSLMENATSIKSVSKVDNVITRLGDSVKTNVTMSEMLEFKDLYENLKKKNFETLQIEGEDTYINNVYYFSAHDESIDEISQRLKEVLELDS